MTSLRGLLEEVDALVATPPGDEPDDYSHWSEEEHSSYQDWLDSAKSETPLTDLLTEVDAVLQTPAERNVQAEVDRHLQTIYPKRFDYAIQHTLDALGRGVISERACQYISDNIRATEQAAA